MQKDLLLLCAASFTDIAIKHPPEKKSYWIRIVVDGNTVFESQRRDPGLSVSWKEKKESFRFLPTSIFEVFLLQKNWRHPRSGGTFGKFIGQPGEIVDFLDQKLGNDIQFEDLQGGRLSTTLAINLSLETNAAQRIMDGIEKDLSGISESKMANLEQKNIDLANQGYSVVGTLGTCIEPLGNALAAMAKIMDSVADAHPLLKVTWTVLSSVYKAVKAQNVLDGRIRDLSNTLKEMLFVAQTVPNLFVVEGTENVIDEISKAALEVATVISQYMESSSLAKRTVKYQLSDSMKGRIDNCQNRCKSLQEKFDRRVHLGVAQDVEHIKGIVEQIFGHMVEHAKDGSLVKRDKDDCIVEHGKDGYEVENIKGAAEHTQGTVEHTLLSHVLNNLAYVKGANWAMELCCLAGTREETISRIMEWIDQANLSKSGEILLVAEVAGAGKSALAHSIARHCQEKGVLKTTFFFQRDIAELRTPIKFISSLAVDLSSHSGPFAQRVCDIIVGERSLASKFSYRQFEELILKPSSLLPTDKPLVVIIDALDGCDEHLDTLLKILRDGVPQLPGMFRFLVTSRPTPELDKHLSGQPHVLRQSLSLNEQSNFTDIRTYISHCLFKIFKGKQPDATLVEAFSMASEGLFIWASTIIMNLQEAFDPEAALRRILDENSPTRLPTEPKMNQLYTSVMERHNWNDPDFIQAYPAVMGMILTAREPLPISALASLNPAISPEIFSNVLGRLHAVLHYLPTGQIPFVHKSFHDFMVTCPSDEPYHLNMADHEQRMATFCLDILNRRLKERIPGSGYLADNPSLLKGIPQVPDDSISDELWYSCRFWIDHCISTSAPGPAVSAALRELIGMNFVGWMEMCASKSLFTGVNPSFMAWLKSVLPDVEEMVYSIPHLVAFARLSERLRYEDRCNEASLVMEPVIERQSAEWINNYLHRSWPIYEPVLSASIFASINQILSRDAILSLADFTLGSKAPRIDKVHTFPKTEDDVILMDWNLSFTPKDTSDMTETEKAQPKIIFAVRVGKGFATATLPILVDDISVSGLLRIRMKLMTNFPYIQIMDISFLEKPDIRYVLKPLGIDTFGLNIASMLRLSSLIRDMTHATLESIMYDPNVFTLNLEQILSDKPLDTAIGVAQVMVRSARGIKIMKDGGTPDPYISLNVENRAELYRTKHKSHTHNAAWMETKFILIHSFKENILLNLLDYNYHSQDTLLGSATFPLSKLLEDQTHEDIVDIIQLDGEDCGELRYDVTYFPVIEAEIGKQEVSDSTVGIVRLMIHQAKELDESKSSSEYLDPLCQVRVNTTGATFQSPIQRQTNAPVWEVPYEFFCPGKNGTKLTVTIIDDREFHQDPVIGYMVIDLVDLLQTKDRASKDWFTLSGCRSGKVRLSAEWKPLGITGSLLGSEQHIPPIGVVRMVIDKAVDIKNTKCTLRGKKRDHYVQVQVQNVIKGRTKVINNNFNPVWNQILYIPVHSLKEQMTLECMDYQHMTKDRSLGSAELLVSDLATKSDNLRFLFQSTGVKTVAAPIELEKGSFKGTLHYTAEFIPSLALKNINFEKQTTEKDPVTPHYDNTRSFLSVFEDDPEVTSSYYRPEHWSAPPSNGHAINATNNVPAATSMIVKPNGKGKSSGAVDNKAENDGVEMNHEELLAQQSGILLLHVISGHLSKKGRLEVLLDDGFWPCMSTVEGQKHEAQWDYVGEGFIKEIDFSRLWLRLNEAAEGERDDIVAEWTGDTKAFLRNTLNGPYTYALNNDKGERDSTVLIEARYIPVPLFLQPRRPIEDHGILRVELLDGREIRAKRGGLLPRSQTTNRLLPRLSDIGSGRVPSI